MGNRSTERYAETLALYPPLSFEYDSESKQFSIGDQTVAVRDYHEFVAPIPEPISYEQAVTIIEKGKLFLNIFDAHFQMPTMYEWLLSLTTEEWSETSEAVTDAMIGAYSEVSGEDTKMLLKGSHWGFGTQLYRPGHPVFTVVGDCACYGVSPHGNFFTEHAWDGGFAEYEAHNIDWSAQLTALHAGAGALAAMVELD